MLLVIDQHPGYGLFSFVEMFAEGEASFIGSRPQLDRHVSIFHKPPAGDTEEIWWSLSGPGESRGSPHTVGIPPEGLAAASPVLPVALWSVPTFY